MDVLKVQEAGDKELNWKKIQALHSEQFTTPRKGVVQKELIWNSDQVTAMA